MKVLLIEPDKILASTYQLALSQSGHKVIHCFGAQSAIHAIDNNNPDVIVLEPQLVNHSGIEFLYELRSYADLQNITVIIHSFIPSQTFIGQIDILNGLGVFEYLYKPLTSLERLVTAVDNAAQFIAV